jgi:hypothetical protein
MAHHCHATGCRYQCPPEKLMCWKHWSKVPVELQRAVYRHYRRGQCNDMNPSREWVDAALAAIRAVAEKEGKVPTVAETLFQAWLGAKAKAKAKAKES